MAGIKECFPKDLDADVLSVILLKVDPNSILKCILVSKRWLEVIASSCFRRSYLEKWKNDSPVVGFMHEYGQFQLVATNKMGSRVNKTKMWTHGIFVNKSRSGDGLMLFFNPQTKVYFLKVTSGVILTSLPPPPATATATVTATTAFKEYTTAIVSSYYKEDGSFKVIRAETGSALSFQIGNTLNIQTFSSSTLMWELSQLESCDSFTLLEDPGIGSIRGMVYWRAETPTSYNKLLVYDTNNQPSIRLIPGPMTCQILPKYHYDVSSQGSLQCATTGKENHIKIWSFDEEDCDWKCLYMVETKSLCKHDLCDCDRDYSPFIFLSFVPGRSDSIFVACDYRASGHLIYIYHAGAQMLERFEGKASCRDINNGQLLPFTIAELGVWPSINPSHIEGNKASSFNHFCASLICH